MIKELNRIGNVKIKRNKSCISCIGEGMKKKLGTTSKIFTKLSDLNVNIEMIAQGPNEINISVIVNKNNLWEIVQKLHNFLIK